MDNYQPMPSGHEVTNNTQDPCQTLHTLQQLNNQLPSNLDSPLPAKRQKITKPRPRRQPKAQTQEEYPLNFSTHLPDSLRQMHRISSKPALPPPGMYYYQDQAHHRATNSQMYPVPQMMDMTLTEGLRKQQRLQQPPLFPQDAHESQHVAMPKPSPISNCHMLSFRALHDQPCYVYCSALPLISATALDPTTGQLLEIRPASLPVTNSTGIQDTVAQYSQSPLRATQQYHHQL